MNIAIKSVSSPFSFFCVAEDENNNDCKIEQDAFSVLVEQDAFSVFVNSKSDKMDISDVNHGQYVAVLWRDKWVRGIISMENNFTIWLVDHGSYIRPNESTVYLNLPAEYRKLPSQVFEASIHGVTPVGLEKDDFYNFKKGYMMNWSHGAINKAAQLIASASSTYFVPVAMLSTKTNDVVIGDLYLQIEKRFVNIIDEMSSTADSTMHLCMERNKEVYIENLSKLYPNKRIHRACLLKPELPSKDLPTITYETTLIEYNAICDEVEPVITQEDEESDTSSVGGSSVTYIENTKDTMNKKLKLTPSEIEQYSNEYIHVNGIEYNVFTVLMNKARDLYICEKYKNGKSVGRATTRKRD